jgi:hypothetical protein
MPFFDSKEQAAEAIINQGRQKIKTAEKMKPKDAIKMHRAGAKEILKGRMMLNKLRQTSDSNNE